MTENILSKNQEFSGFAKWIKKDNLTVVIFGNPAVFIRKSYRDDFFARPRTLSVGSFFLGTEPTGRKIEFCDNKTQC